MTSVVGCQFEWFTGGWFISAFWTFSWHFSFRFTFFSVILHHFHFPCWKEERSLSFLLSSSSSPSLMWTCICWKNTLLLKKCHRSCIEMPVFSGCIVNQIKSVDLLWPFCLVHSFGLKSSLKASLRPVNLSHFSPFVLEGNRHAHYSLIRWCVCLWLYLYNSYAEWRLHCFVSYLVITNFTFERWTLLLCLHY